MKIIHVLNSLTIGGREKVVIELCNELVKTNEIVVITLTNDENLQKIKLDKNIKLIELPFKSDLKGIFQLWVQGFFLLKKYFNQIKPDIVHNHLYYHFYLFLTLVSCFKKFKSYRTIHTSGLFYKDKGIINKFRLSVEKIANYINKPYLVSISRSIFNNNELFFKKYYSDNKYIPNGINFTTLNQNDILINRKDLGLDENDFVGVYVARLDEGKNHQLLVNCINNLFLSEINVKMLFVGDGPLREVIQKQITFLNLTNSITILGFQNKVSDYLKLANFGIFPSSFEGFGLSLIEKMYFKLPVIVSNIDVFEEIIENNYNGLIFNLDRPEEMEKKIKFLIENKSKIQEIGERAFLTAKEFSIQKISEQTECYYKYD